MAASGGVESGCMVVGLPLNESAPGWNILASGSPAFNAAEGTNVIMDDLEGQPRAQPDVGADEVSIAPVLRLPLTGNDVGPSAP